MDFTQLTGYFQVVVLVACLSVGYMIKHSFKSFNNDYIPVVMGCLGAVLNCMVLGIGIENFVYGLVTGLASTGMHEAFKAFIEGK